VGIVNDQFFRQFILQVIAPIILMLLGVGILVRAKKANYGEVMQIGGIAIIGIVFIVGAGVLFAIGGQIADRIAP